MVLGFSETLRTWMPLTGQTMVQRDRERWTPAVPLIAALSSH